MNTIMFLSGTVVGLFLGAILWEVLVAGPQYLRLTEREWRLNERLRAWQRMALVEYAQTQRDATAKAMDAIVDNDRHSVKVPDLSVVK
jgi:hypothetical protein